MFLKLQCQYSKQKKKKKKKDGVFSQCGWFSLTGAGLEVGKNKHGLIRAF